MVRTKISKIYIGFVSFYSVFNVRHCIFYYIRIFQLEGDFGFAIIDLINKQHSGFLCRTRTFDFRSTHLIFSPFSCPFQASNQTILFKTYKQKRTVIYGPFEYLKKQNNRRFFLKPIVYYLFLVSGNIR